MGNLVAAEKRQVLVSWLCSELQARVARLPAPYEAYLGVLPLLPIARLSTHEAMQAVERAEGALARTRHVGLGPFDVSAMAAHEARSSCEIDGVFASRDEVFSFIKTGRFHQASALQRDLHLAIMSLFGEARDNGPGIFSMDMVLDLHTRIMRSDEAYSGSAGLIRREVVWIGGSDISEAVWVPPPPDAVQECLSETLALMRGEKHGRVVDSIVVRTAPAHAHFNAVHPFSEGGGRVSRLLMLLMFAAEGYPPLPISGDLRRHEGAYRDALLVAAKRLSIDPLVNSIGRALEAAIQPQR